MHIYNNTKEGKMMSVPRYWREMPERTRLEAAKCNGCGIILFPPRGKCMNCGSESFVQYALPRRGKLITFTIVRSPTKGFEKQVPYVLGMVELEDGTKITVPLTDVFPEDVSIGMNVEAVFRKVFEDGESGIIEYAIKFRPTL
jgi:uncharacterized OB-fold protein